MKIRRIDEAHPFLLLLKKGIAQGGFTNDDTIAIILPILEETYGFHKEGMVAPLDDFSKVLITNDRLDVDEAFTKEPVKNFWKLRRFFKEESRAFTISEKGEALTEFGDGQTYSYKSNAVESSLDAKIDHPVYLLNYACYEHFLGHHDGASDVFVLGMILASLALSADFTEEDELRQFVQNRSQMIYLNPNIHPAIANVILGMTHLNRNERWTDLGEIIQKLRNYRDYNPEHEQDLSLIANAAQGKNSRSQFINGKLRSRLFDLSRRNRMLYFKPNLKFLNLTVASVPILLSYRNINPKSLFIWDALSNQIIQGKKIPLSKYLRTADNPYIVPALNRIRLEANRDKNEYGFSQLKLVVSFLNWYNTKEDSKEKIVSPLVLLPVNLTRKKGVKDQYILEVKSQEAELNPILIYQLRELYDIKLPDTIDLNEVSLDDLYQSIKSQIEASNSGVSIELIQKPKIKLIHSVAKQTLNQYTKRTRKRKTGSSFHHLNYSYDSDSFEPLGLKLFKTYVNPESTILEAIINPDIVQSPMDFAARAEREFYELDKGGVNPFLWEMDTSNIILGNFNYKKMSLVRDYNFFIEEDEKSEVFDELFDDAPRKNWNTENARMPINEGYHVVPSDPSQASSIFRARTGENYIIQGPPGTGKSQTITNLIADFIARKKKVLFVCEKKAALDVVFFRLKQQGLDELCALIHDSQEDKKPFIKNLKKTYESFIKTPNHLPKFEEQRQQLLAAIEQEISVIRKFNNLMVMDWEDAGISLRSLLDILVDNGGAWTQNIANVHEYPSFKSWKDHKHNILELDQKLSEIEGSKGISEHPFSYLKWEESVLNTEMVQLQSNVKQSQELIGQILGLLEFADLPAEAEKDLENLSTFLNELHKLKPFVDQNALGLLDANSADFRDFESEIKSVADLQETARIKASKNNHWSQKLSPSDTEQALAEMQKYESSIFRIISPGYYKLKKIVQQHYNFSKHAVQPSFSSVLEKLRKEQIALEKLEHRVGSISKKWGLGNPLEIHQELKHFHANPNALLNDYLEEKGEDIQEGLTIHSKLNELLKASTKYFEIPTTFGSEAYEEALNQLQGSLNRLPGFLPYLKDLSKAEPALKTFLKTKKIPVAKMEAKLSEVSVQRFYDKHLDIQNLEGEVLGYHLKKLKVLHDQLFEVNANLVKHQQIEYFKSLVRISEQSVAGKTLLEKDAKKRISQGRKILENEFQKSIRYKSIRDLGQGEAGKLIRSLKPVWLMSPLSVSDTLPLDKPYFDVVIFDEASQITLEEGIPPLFRAAQTIVVGDEMQMPPSNFFNTGTNDPNDLWVDDEEETEEIPLDADSLLVQGARKLPSITLGWHYRSRYESLISFSNAAFYEQSLLTIPDKSIAKNDLGEIKVLELDAAKQNVETVFDRPISYHFLPKGVYEKRGNEQEAEYIAQLVRELLNHKEKLSIGIVAFSMQQQGIIENAITRLASEDSDFERMIEEEQKREEDNQFVGLFVKNLENVQGDERDVIIMSTCYGFNKHGKMIMNFGPINRRGGEKRLNVIFSRAKKHMLVVSSIKFSDIKNEHNEGANYFRKYLQYAENVSLGNQENAMAILNNLFEGTAVADQQNPFLIDELAKEIEKMGYKVEKNIGQSFFKCHIGVYEKAEDDQFLLGILVDDERHYDNEDLLEQYLLRPGILKQFGWQIMQVYAKDFFQDKGKVLEQIKNQLLGKAVEEEPIILSLPEIENEEPEQAEILEAKAPKLTFTKLQNTEGSSDKFWHIAQEELELIIHYGRTGIQGQKLRKLFETKEKAFSEMEKMISKKMAKGYVKIGD